MNKQTKEGFKQQKVFNNIKKYVLLSLIIFSISTIIGFTLPIFFKEQIFNLLQNLVNIFEGKGLLETIILIFFNNAKTSFLVMIFGIALGVFPLITLTINGYLLGFVARLAVQEEGIGILWRIIPHGIFELPAVFLSAGLGIRLGITLIKQKKEFKNILKESLQYYLYIIIPLLIIAAIIESVFIFLLP